MGRTRSSWEDVRRRRAEALASLGLLDQSAIYREPNHSEEGSEEDADIVDIVTQPEPTQQPSTEKDECELGHGSSCLCCSDISEREPSILAEGREDELEARSVSIFLHHM